MYFLMLLYLVLVFIIMKKKTKTNMLLAMLPLIVITMIRYGIGTDYFSYNYLYDLFPATSITDVFTAENEVGYNLLVFVSKTLNIDYHLFSTILTLTMLFVYCYWIYKNSENWKLSLLIFYGFFYIVWILSAYRQGIAVALGTALFFSKDKELSLKKQLLYVLALSTIHYSALIYLFYIFMERVVLKKVEMSRKNHIILTCSSIVLSIAIVKLAPILIPHIPVLKNIYFFKDLDGGWALFPSLIRILFFVIVIYFYDAFEKDSFEYRILQIHLIGYPLYFLMKFSELLAGRFFVYSFVLIVLLLPYIYSKQKERLIRLGLVTVITGISTVYLYKDLKAYEHQVGFVGDSNWFTYQTIFNKDTHQFYNRYSILVDHEEQMNEYIKQSQNQLDNNEVRLEQEIIVKDKGKYYILNKEGKKIERFEFDEKPELYNGIVEYNGLASGITIRKFVDINGNDILTEKALEIKNEFLKENIHYYSEKPDYTEPKIDEIPQGARKNFNTSIDDSYMWHFEEPFKYYYLELEYYYRKYYFLLDENKNLLVDMMFRRVDQFDHTGIAKVYVKDKVIYINKDGGVVWIDNEK